MTLIRSRYFSLLAMMIFMIPLSCTNTETAEINSLFSALYPDDQPGAAVAIVKDGKVFFKKGYGIADTDSKTGITSTTNFNICSLTKQFTAYAILKLEKEKALSLDDEIDKYLSELTSKATGSVTIRNLLTHSSGIADHYGYVNPSLYREFSDKDVLDAIKNADTLYFAPGTKYRYSNTAYCLLSLIIERVSGVSYQDYVRENTFKPLGMNNSDVIVPGFQISNRAYGYEFENDTFKISDAGESLFFSTKGDGGIYTSADDYLKWILAIENGKITDPDLIREAHTARRTIDPGGKVSYGYGWFVSGAGDKKIVYHTGSNGGFRTIVFMIPSIKYAVVIFSNRTGIDLEDLVGKINAILNAGDPDYARIDSLTS